MASSLGLGVSSGKRSCAQWPPPETHACRHGAGPRGFMATLSQYMLSSAATFSFFLSIGSVSLQVLTVSSTRRAMSLGHSKRLGPNAGNTDADGSSKPNCPFKILWCSAHAVTMGARAKTHGLSQLINSALSTTHPRISTLSYGFGIIRC